MTNHNAYFLFLWIQFRPHTPAASETAPHVLWWLPSFESFRQPSNIKKKGRHSINEISFKVTKFLYRSCLEPGVKKYFIYCLPLINIWQLPFNSLADQFATELSDSCYRKSTSSIYMYMCKGLIYIYIQQKLKFWWVGGCCSIPPTTIRSSVNW